MKKKRVLTHKNKNLPHVLEHDSGVSENTQSYNSVDAAFQSKELFLIGFATILVAWAWVSIFSLLFPSKISPYSQARVSYPLRVVVLDVTRNLSDELSNVSVNLKQGGQLAIQVAGYQVTTLWESACSLRDRCSDLAFSQKFVAREAFQQIAAIFSDIRMFRSPEGVVQSLSYSGGQSAVLGANTSEPSTIAVEAIHVGRCYVNAITAGILASLDTSFGQCR